jgi:hypothetical protein
MLTTFVPCLRDPSPHERGTADLDLAFGHWDEYNFPLLPHERVWQQDYELEPDDPKAAPPVWVKNRIARAQNGGSSNGDWMFVYPGHAAVISLQGPVVNLWRRFYSFANSVDPECDPTDYTPGGDDDTYDYYPGAFAALAEWANDLDRADAMLSSVVYRKFSAHERVARVVKNLHRAKGPFEEWEFEDYAAPYLKAAGLEPQPDVRPKGLIPGTLMRESGSNG